MSGTEFWTNRMAISVNKSGGPQGPAGAAGADGLSAYEVAVANGFVGNEAAWLASLVGADGADGPQGPAGPTGATGPAGADGPPIVGINTFASPTLLANSGAIAAQTNQRERRYVKGSGGATTGITITAPADTSKHWELYLEGLS